MIKLGYVIAYVSDVDNALSFFESAFKLERKFLTEEKDYGELETGSTILAFATHELGESNFTGGYQRANDSDKPLGMEIALITDDVKASHAMAIKFGAQELKEPEQKPWGQTVSYVRCPAGLLIELCTSMSD